MSDKHPNILLIAKWGGSTKVFFCNDCKVLHPDPYMVKNEVWNTIAKPRERLFLCLECLSKRLDRALTIDDFTDAPINNPIHLGYRMAKAEQ